MSVFEHETADLYLYAAEMEMSYIYSRYTTVKAVYNNCRDNFVKACDIIGQLSLQDQFASRCKDLVEKSNHVYSIETEIKEAYASAF